MAKSFVAFFFSKQFVFLIFFLDDGPIFIRWTIGYRFLLVVIDAMSMTFTARVKRTRRTQDVSYIPLIIAIPAVFILPQNS